MTLTLKAAQTARRNLVQRIDSVLVGWTDGSDPGAAFFLAQSIEHLRHQDYREGEWLVSKAEQPEIWRKAGTTPDRLSIAALKLAFEAAKAVDVLEV